MSKLIELSLSKSKATEAEEEEISFFNEMSKENRKLGIAVGVLLFGVIASLGLAILALAHMTPYIKQVFLP